MHHNDRAHSVFCNRIYHPSAVPTSHLPQKNACVFVCVCVFVVCSALFCLALETEPHEMVFSPICLAVLPSMEWTDFLKENQGSFICHAKIKIQKEMQDLRDNRMPTV